MKRPQEHEYNSFTAYARALENYCTSLEQPEPEPVKVMSFDCVCGRRMVVESDNGVVASTPKREPLSDEQFYAIARESGFDVELMKSNKSKGMPSIAEIFGRNIEAAHGIKEKNT